MKIHVKCRKIAKFLHFTWLSPCRTGINYYKMSIKSVLGKNIKHYRKMRRLSQEQLSEKAGITPKHLSTIETGLVFVSADLLEKLTRILEIPASTLFYDKEGESLDDTFFGSADRLVETELAKAACSIKDQLRHLSGLPDDS